ncbi:MAG: hypothetical protein H0V88_11175 [Pyrinomonadaceae bacterium]|nr:hypothetical protein [Pyrinomonadaceae bacterium]
MKNILRTGIIALVMLALVAASVPTMDSFARYKGRNSIGRRAHSKRFHRSRRAWLQRRRAAARRRRARLMRRRMQMAAATRAVPTGGALATNPYLSSNPYATREETSSTLNRTSLRWTLPAGWSGASGSRFSSEAKWNVRGSDGRVIGSAVLRPVSSVDSQNASGVSRARLKPIGGIPVTTLRRTVIDRMVAAGGWVVNDWVRELGGRRVYIVSAQTGTAGDPSAPAQSWSFYFFEADDRVYSLATNTAPEYADNLVSQTELMVASLQRSDAGAQTANSSR